MLQSMTGFSEHTITIPGEDGQSPVSLSIELKSLNSRYFELSSRLPSSLNMLETIFLQKLKEKLVRGRVYLTIQMGSGHESFAHMVPSVALARQYCDGLREIARSCDLEEKIALTDLLSLPNLFTAEKKMISAKQKDAIIAGVMEAADGLTAARSAEGEALHEDLRARFAFCDKSIGAIAALHEELMSEQKKRISQVQEQANEGDEQAKSQLDDLFSQLNKMDVSEEITRFTTHLKTVYGALNDKSIEKGKRIDFLIQEFLREINTTSAKCSNAQLSTLAVDVKVELEKAREQVQNVL